MTTFGQGDVTGYNSSNVADLGFFITKIQLKPDSTFKYEFYGDLMYDKWTGKYRIESKKLIKVIFDRDSIDILGFSRTTNRPKQLLIRNNKLYEFKQNGKVLKRGPGMSGHKKYLFFGDYYMTTRKMYLKKRKGNLIWRGEENASR